MLADSFYQIISKSDIQRTISFTCKNIYIKTFHIIWILNQVQDDHVTLSRGHIVNSYTSNIGRFRYPVILFAGARFSPTVRKDSNSAASGTERL